MRLFDREIRGINLKLCKDAKVNRVFPEIVLRSYRPLSYNFFAIVGLVIKLKASG